MRVTLPAIALFLSLLPASCKRSDKDTFKHLAWMDSIKDPLLARVPDSLRYLIPILDTVLRTDQKYRSTTNPGLYSKNIAEQQRLDSVNQLTITAILDKHGWLGMKDVGIIGQKAIDMTMVHAPIALKLKYYPMLIAAFRQNKLPGETVALYEDKMNGLLKREQYYGTQVTTFNNKRVPFPIYDLANVDARRKMLRIIPLSNYLKMFGGTWDSLQYVQLLPALKKEKNVSDTAPIHVDLQEIISQRVIDSLYKKHP